MDYPSNSNSKKAAPAPAQEPKVVESVVTGTVSLRKPSIGKRLKETFVGGDAQSVWAYVAYDILIPAIKDTVADAFSMGIERMLFGDTRGGSTGRRGRPSGAPGRVDYGSFSKPAVNRYGREETRTMSRSARASHNFSEILLDSRVEAERVVEMMSLLCDQYQVVKVSELYDLVGVTGDFTDEKYGWYDMRGVSIDRVRGGQYLINLPRPEVLKD